MVEGTLKRRFTRIALAATLSLGSGGLAAQDIPEGQSCGGLVCDLGLFGHKTAPKPAPQPATVGVPVPPPQSAVARPEPRQESKRAAGRKKAHVAKAAPTKATPPKATARAPGIALGAAPVAATLSPSTVPAAPPPASPVAAALSPPPSMVAPPAPPPIPVTPSQPVVLANPYVYHKPLPFMFQSVDPTQSVQ